jgi:haloalkane dehalogenase
MVGVHRAREVMIEPVVPDGARLGHTTVEVDGTELELAHVELGPADGPTVVLLHGEPTYSRLWRDVMPPLADAGLRAVAPDLVGFGRSDKPTDLHWYTFERLTGALDAHLQTLSPGPFTLVVHDWGGVLGLPWAVENPARVERLVILDTGLYSPGGFASDTWQAFRDFVERTPELPIAFLVDGGTHRELSDEEKAAYAAPFPDAASQAGARALPLLVPRADDDPGAQRLSWARERLSQWHAPTLVLWGAADHVLPVSIGESFAKAIPDCGDVELVADAGHFLQEDAGEHIGARIAQFAAETTPSRP